MFGRSAGLPAVMTETFSSLSMYYTELISVWSKKDEQKLGISVNYCDKAVLNQVAPLLIKMFKGLVCNFSFKARTDYLWYQIKLCQCLCL